MTAASDASDSSLDALRRLASPVVSDAIQNLEVRSPVKGYADIRLRSLSGLPEPMVGFALPVTIDATSDTRPERNRVAELLEAVAAAPDPVVLVCQEVGPWPDRAAHVGGILAQALLERGAVGVVTDVGVRDVDELRKLGLHVFARGTVVSHANHRVCEINAPVEVCGMRVQPGDLVHGDVNGCVCFPGDLAGRVVQAAEAVLAYEKRVSRELATEPDTSGEHS